MNFLVFTHYFIWVGTMAPILARAAPSKQSITASHEATSKPSNKNAKMEDKRRHLSKLRSIVPPSATTLHLTQLLDAGPPKAKKKARPDAKRLKEPIIAVGTASTLALSRATDIFGTVQDCLGGIRETVPIKKTATLSKNDLVNDKHQMKPRKSFFPHSNIALTNGNKRSSSDNQVNANEASQKAIIDNDPTVAEHESTNSMKAAPFMNLNDNSVVKNRMLPVESSARRASKPLLYFQEKRPAKKRLRISHRQATSLVPTDDAAAATEGSREPTGDNSQVVLPSPTCRVERTELFAVAAVQDRSALPYTVSTVSTNAAPSKMPTSLNAASQSIPRPNGMGTVALANTTKKQQQKGNFVRLNLRNKAGSCLGARNVKAKSKAKLQWEQRKKDRMDLYKAEHGGADEKGMNQLFSVSGAAFTSAGVDPVDDFVDGVFAPDNAANGDDAMKNAESNQRKHSPTIPTCSGHQQPCKLLTVKKSGPYKGRKFYACPCPRGEQCNHFLWADDTLQVFC